LPAVPPWQHTPTTHRLRDAERLRYLSRQTCCRIMRLLSGRVAPWLEKPPRRPHFHFNRSHLTHPFLSTSSRLTSRPSQLGPSSASLQPLLEAEHVKGPEDWQAERFQFLFDDSKHALTEYDVDHLLEPRAPISDIQHRSMHVVSDESLPRLVEHTGNSRNTCQSASANGDLR
jgi:hypothetical protein